MVSPRLQLTAYRVLQNEKHLAVLCFQLATFDIVMHVYIDFQEPVHNNFCAYHMIVMHLVLSGVFIVYILNFHVSQKSVVRNPNSKKSSKSKQKSNTRKEILSEIGYLV